jgi:hypothetical protein
MYKWYERYSYWVLILSVLSKLGIVPINMYPSVLYVLVGTIVILYLKYTNKVPMSTTYLIYTFCVHAFPLLLVPHAFTWGDVVKNVLIYGVYVACIGNVYQIYKEGVYVDSNKTLVEILKDRGILSVQSVA